VTTAALCSSEPKILLEQGNDEFNNNKPVKNMSMKKPEFSFIYNVLKFKRVDHIEDKMAEVEDK
jgi:hypothetical protein